MGRIKVFLVLAITRRSAELKAVFFKIRFTVIKILFQEQYVISFSA